MSDGQQKEAEIQNLQKYVSTLEGELDQVHSLSASTSSRLDTTVKQLAVVTLLDRIPVWHVASRSQSIDIHSTTLLSDHISGPGRAFGRACVSVSLSLSLSGQNGIGPWQLAYISVVTQD